ncbi:MAG: radical SAM protein [Methanocorpusculum sp.]|nr:radical SAM protein [Methanocorpusculum sp.]
MVDTLLFVTRNEQTRDVAHQLKGLSVRAYYIPHYLYSDIFSVPNLRDASVVVDLQKPRLNYLEFHVADHCNLNCKGCTHFSNLESKAHFTDFVSCVRDLERLKELFWGIDRIRLMGGEALLNPELWKFVEATRKIFPDTDLRVVTNGLLLPKISDQLVSVMLDAHAGFDISHYIPTGRMHEKILAKLTECGVEYSYASEEIATFWRRLTLHPVSRKEDAFLPCSCNFLRNGLLSICPFVGLIDKFNTAYGLSYPTGERHNIYEVQDAWKLYEALHSPAEFCRYCEPYADRFAWEQRPGKTACADDWLVDESRIPALRRRQKISNLKSAVAHPKAQLGIYCNKYPGLGRYVRYIYYEYFSKN